MILRQIAWVDCFAFLLFLAPQLIIHVGLISTISCVLKALPFFLFKLPYQLIHTRYFVPRAKQPPFIRQATLFQDVVIRCVRYAFTYIPAAIGKVFFSKRVALPFLRFRMLRHGHLHSPIHWHEIHEPEHDLHGLYLVADPTRRPDVVLYYCHGGGFSMGSAYFYLEFLLAWLHLLRTEARFANPAIFALEYTLVPDATYPTQLHQTLAGYAWTLKHLAHNDPTLLAVSGDSAGATLILSLLLHLSQTEGDRSQNPQTSQPRSKQTRLPLPALALPISPWTTLLSPANANTPADYLNASTLETYGNQYIGTPHARDPLHERDAHLISPGTCKSASRWRRASPAQGWYFVFGAEEVFAPETREMVATLGQAGVEVRAHEEAGWVHAWPVVKLFLCCSEEERLSGVRRLVRVMGERVGKSKKVEN